VCVHTCKTYNLCDISRMFMMYVTHIIIWVSIKLLFCKTTKMVPPRGFLGLDISLCMYICGHS